MNQIAIRTTDEETAVIDKYAEEKNISRSAAGREVFIRGLELLNKPVEEIRIPVSSDEEKKIRFKIQFSYFSTNVDYRCYLFAKGTLVAIYYGGEWKTYTLSEIPAEVV